MQTEVAAPQISPSKESDKIVIQVKNALKRFGKNELVVSDLSFEVRQGEIFCLLGPSGSGKSTILRMLIGVYNPTEGEVKVLGYEPRHFNREARKQIGYMPQHFVLFPELSTLENINFMASVYGMSWFGRRKKVQKVLEFVELWESRKKLASQLSGGMQRRLELATTLVHDPQLIFVDEPTAGIDPVLRAKFWDHFKALRDEARTIFLTTQYVTEADYCDTVAVLNKGKLLALGSPEDIRQKVIGGELIDLTLDEITSQSIRLLRSIPELLKLQATSGESLRLTVVKAHEVLPKVIEILKENNINIQKIEPYRPDFEEVFVQLLKQAEKLEQTDNQNEVKPDTHSELLGAKG